MRLEADVESGFLLEGVVPATVGLRLRLPRRFELSSRLSLLSDVYERPAELAALASTHVLYRWAQSARFDFRTGIGARLFALDVVRAGGDLLYAVDGYIADRFILRIELHLGWLGSALAGQARATFGAALRRFELYAGYDHTVFISEAYRASLGGPVAGLRTWF